MRRIIFFINEARAWRRLLFGPRDIHRDSQRLKLGTVTWMEAQSLKDFKNVVIHP
jgi:hypothetical protein